jgi:protein-tyrosine phosphatase
MMRAILFVCLGNICRSPLAEAAFRKAAGEAGIEVRVDSAGTGDWHVGHAPDGRAQAEAKRHGVDIAPYRARQVRREDFTQFDMIVAMDGHNLADLRQLAPAGSKARIILLLDSVPGRSGQSVADPYYGDASDFAVTWNDVSLGAAHLLEALTQEEWWSLAGSNR